MQVANNSPRRVRSMPRSKRRIDIIFALLGLIISFPLFVFVAIAIWLEDGWPIIFRQRRIGLKGRIFSIYKFRKFSNRECSPSSHVTLTDDARYSRVGKFLDKTKLNELPQLVNVLRGDMSIIGPRPEIPEFSHCFRGRHQTLLDIVPGIFGPSQTIFRNEATLYPSNQDADQFYEKVLFPEKADIDLQYYSKATNASDMRWIYRSLMAVFASRYDANSGPLVHGADQDRAAQLRQNGPAPSTDEPSLHGINQTSGVKRLNSIK
ncbi:MAG: sugar transferase [Dichotomicrobium sp.]